MFSRVPVVLNSFCPCFTVFAETPSQTALDVLFSTESLVWRCVQASWKFPERLCLHGNVQIQLECRLRTQGATQNMCTQGKHSRAPGVSGCDLESRGNFWCSS